MRKFIGSNPQTVNLFDQFCYTEQPTRYGKLHLKYLVQDRKRQLEQVQSEKYLQDTHIHLACFDLNNRKSFDTVREIRRKLFRMNFDQEMKDRMRQNFIIVGIRSEPSKRENPAQEDHDPNEAFSDSSSLASSSYETANTHCTCSSEGRPCWRVQQLQEEQKVDEEEEEEDRETEELRKKQEEEGNKITKQDIKIIKRKWKSVYYEVDLQDTNCLGTRKLYADMIGRLVYLTQSPFQYLCSSILPGCTALPDFTS